MPWLQILKKNQENPTHEPDTLCRVFNAVSNKPACEQVRAMHRHCSRSAEIKQVRLCFNGLYTPFGSPVIGGQKRLLTMFSDSLSTNTINPFRELCLIRRKTPAFRPQKPSRVNV